MTGTGGAHAHFTDAIHLLIVCEIQHSDSDMSCNENIPYLEGALYSMCV